MKTHKTKIISGLLLTVLPYIVLAQSNTNTTFINIQNPTNTGSDLLALLRTILVNIVLPVAAVLIVMYIIYAGFTFVSARGKPKEIEDAKKRLLWALIGTGVILGAAGISDVVVNTVRAIFP